MDNEDNANTPQRNNQRSINFIDGSSQERIDRREAVRDVYDRIVEHNRDNAERSNSLRQSARDLEEQGGIRNRLRATNNRWEAFNIELNEALSNTPLSSGNDPASVVNSLQRSPLAERQLPADSDTEAESVSSSHTERITRERNQQQDDKGCGCTIS